MKTCALSSSRRLALGAVAVTGLFALFAALLASSPARATEASSGANGNGVSAAKATVARVTRSYTTWTSTGPAFNAAKARGKTVWFIGLDMSIPALQLASNLIHQALTPLGVKEEVCDGKGSPEGWKRCVDLAVARHGNAMILESFDPQLVVDGLRRAHAAGIKVIDGNNGDPAGPLYKYEDARVAFPYSAGGRAVADWVIADSNGKADVLIVFTSDAPNWHALVTNGYAAEFKARCPGCKVKIKNVPIAQWSTALQPLTQSSIVADPKLNYIIPAFDGMSTFMVPGVQAAGASSRVKIATFNANLDPMRNLQRHNVIYEDLGTHNPYLAYAYADQALRLMSGVPPVRDEHIPIRMFTRSNVRDLKIDQKTLESGTWYGNGNFKDGFRKQWAGK